MPFVLVEGALHGLWNTFRHLFSDVLFFGVFSSLPIFFKGENRKGGGVKQMFENEKDHPIR